MRPIIGRSYLLPLSDFELLAGDSGVALLDLGEEAFLGGDARSLSIDVDRATFEHKRGPIPGYPVEVADLGGHEVVIGPRVVEATVEATPCVEYPVDAAALAPGASLIHAHRTVHLVGDPAALDEEGAA